MTAHSWLSWVNQSPAVGFDWILRLFGAVFETQHLSSICFYFASGDHKVSILDVHLDMR